MNLSYGTSGWEKYSHGVIVLWAFAKWVQKQIWWGGDPALAQYGATGPSESAPFEEQCGTMSCCLEQLAENTFKTKVRTRVIETT